MSSVFVGWKSDIVEIGMTHSEWAIKIDVSQKYYRRISNRPEVYFLHQHNILYSSDLEKKLLL